MRKTRAFGSKLASCSISREKSAKMERAIKSEWAGCRVSLRKLWKVEGGRCRSQPTNPASGFLCAIRYLPKACADQGGPGSGKELGGGGTGSDCSMRSRGSGSGCDGLGKPTPLACGPAHLPFRLFAGARHLYCIVLDGTEGEVSMYVPQPTNPSPRHEQ